MGDRPIVVGLGGSLSARSASGAALKVALDAAAEHGAETALFDVRTMDLPMFRRGVEAPSAAVELCEATFEAQGMIWSSPMYHGTVSGLSRTLSTGWTYWVTGTRPFSPTR